MHSTNASELSKTSSLDISGSSKCENRLWQAPLHSTTRALLFAILFMSFVQLQDTPSQHRHHMHLLYRSLHHNKSFLAVQLAAKNSTKQIHFVMLFIKWTLGCCQSHANINHDLNIVPTLLSLAINLSHIVFLPSHTKCNPPQLFSTFLSQLYSKIVTLLLVVVYYQKCHSDI